MAAVYFFVFVFGVISVCQGRNENQAVLCPDGTECSEAQTCCQISDSRYGCCVLPKAVCCADRAHCCPERSACDLKRQRCIPEILLQKKAIKSHWSMGQSTPVHKEFDKLMYLIYNRNGNFLPEKKDCLGCPLTNGVCCPDGLHCCPQHMNCGPTSKSCIGKEDLTNTVLITETEADEIKFDNSFPFSEIKTLDLTDQVCPGGEMKCRDNDTCCKLPKTESYACCPLSKATCCSDGHHCCPNGMQCDLVHMRCIESENHESLTKTNLKATAYCPDGKTQCPDNTTCCQTASGYGCCPFRDATCCTDKLHCCPKGFQCDLSAMSCRKKEINFDAARLLPGKITLDERTIVCPGGHFKCPDNTTCCVLPDGRYGCCPYPRAVCCSDKEHCCPESTKCDIPHQRCVQKWFYIPFARVLLAEKIET